MRAVDLSKHEKENKRIMDLLCSSLKRRRVKTIYKDGIPVGREVLEVFRSPEGKPDVHNGNISSKITLRFVIMYGDFRGFGLSDYVTLFSKNGNEEGWYKFDDPREVGSYLFYQYITPINRFTAWVNEGGMTVAEWFYALVNFSNIFVVTFEQRNGGKTREEVDREEKRKRMEELRKTLRRS